MKLRATLLTLVSAVGLTLAQDAATVIEVKPSTNIATPLAYEKADFTAKATTKVKLTINNNGGVLPQPHNIVLCKPGTAEKVIAAALQMITDPTGMAKSYVPESPDILAHTKFAQPGQSESVEVTLPAEVGDYPFFCTYPGHSAIMKGILKVTN
jgi:azurin